MDFNRNPLPASDGVAFSLENLDDDVRAYLENNDALHEMPIDRLKRMNPLAIELYRMHGNDIETDPLPFNVSNQHMNGGVAVDPWNETSLAGCFAVGEVAGTHGVTRPGGAALNAGQVGGMRVADQVASRDLSVSTVDADAVSDEVCDAVTMIETALATDNGLNVADTRALFNPACLTMPVSSAKSRKSQQPYKPPPNYGRKSRKKASRSIGQRRPSTSSVGGILP